MTRTDQYAYDAGLDRVCTVTTLRAPLAETLEFVAYHLSIGVERVILFFDDPLDPSVDALVGEDRVTCVRCDGDYWDTSGLPAERALEERQDYNASRGLAIAREWGYEWVIHIDSDELLYVPGGLRETLTQVEPTEIAVRFSVLEGVPLQYHYGSPLREVNTFRVGELPLMRLRTGIAKALGCGAAFYAGHYFRAQTDGKTAVRTNAHFKSLGIHTPWMDDGSRYPAPSLEGAHILHYDTCGLDAFMSKWRKRLDGTAVTKREGALRRRQMEEFAGHSSNEAELKRLYERLHFLSGYQQRILWALGLLKQIEVQIPRRIDLGLTESPTQKGRGCKYSSPAGSSGVAETGGPS